MNISNMYTHTHMHILSLYILSSNSLPLIFFYCILVFCLSSSLSVSLSLSLEESARERERDGRKGGERGDEMRKRRRDEKWRRTSCGQRGKRRAVRAPHWDIQFCGVRSDFEMLDQLNTWIDIWQLDPRADVDMGQHELSLRLMRIDFTEEMVDHWDWKLVEVGTSFLKEMETKGIMDLCKYILLFFALSPKGK